MSEGPEVKIIADKLAEVLLGRKFVDVFAKRIEAKPNRISWVQK